jgi:hypothetical protein
LYRVAFIVDESFSAISGDDIPNVYQLIIEKATDETEPLDAKVAKTLGEIIEGFFRNEENSLIFICSDEDDKANIRFNKFDRWYSNSEYKSVIVKIDNIIHVKISENESQKMYTSFMFHRNNSNHEKLIEIYSQFERILNEDK